ncbi:beta strand repeat-containing protein [Marimonas lutisalis]|uniref:beta strand repeat-containing protein n=1 Tax=Marimonas lutisalis TaxID=2545756 RepID=UPI0010F91C9D|nr:calcium-binding protein [Marimonas lutisalis]
MATYSVTTSNWNSPAFWASVSQAGPGHVLDFSSLPSNYTVSYDTDTGAVTISEGTSSFVVGDTSYAGTPDASLGGTTIWHYFTTLSFGDGDHYVAGGYNGEVITTGSGDDTIFANGGADTVNAGDGNNVVYSGPDADSVTSGSGLDTILAGDGNDTVSSGAGDDFVDGGAGADLIYGGDGDDHIEGGWEDAGADTIYGGNGNDLVLSGDGLDVVYGEARYDWIDGGWGADYLDGGSEDDRIVGHEGNDTILGGTGNDILNGGAGSDSVVGGDGQDSIWGAAGDTIDGGEGGIDIDTLYVSDVSSISYATAESGTVFFNGGGSLSFTNIENVVTLSNDGIVQGTAGADEIGQFYFDADGDWVENDDAPGGGEADAIHAGAGDDKVWSNEGNDTVYGEAGNDYLYTGSDNDSVHGGTGSDTVLAESGNDTIFGGGDGDSILGGAGDDSIIGGAGVNDTDLKLSWAAAGVDEQSLAGGFEQDTGGISVSVSFVDQGNAGTISVETTDVQYVGTGEPFSTTSSASMGGGATTGDTSTTTVDFSAVAGSGFADEVANVSFRINDLDQSGWEDIVTIRAYDAAGNPVNVDLLYQGVTTSGIAPSEDGEGSWTQADAAGSMLVTITGPVSYFEIDYDQAGTAGQTLWVTDIHFTAVPETDGADTIDGGTGADIISGNDGDDLILLSDDFGNDTITGGETGEVNGDTLDASGVTASGVDVTFSGVEAGTVAGGTSTASFSEIENMVLTDQNDTVNADLDVDGVDIDARGGDDSVLGSQGADNVDGGTGNDTLRGGQGSDTLSGGDGINYLHGDEGNDSLVGSSTSAGGFTQMEGGAGADTLDGTAGYWDIASYYTSAGAVNVNLTDGLTETGGDALGDTLSGIEQIDGSNTGNDTIVGDTGVYEVKGWGGDDILTLTTAAGGMAYGGDGADTITGGAGNDTLDGDDGLATGGADVIYAGAGNDQIIGDAGADSLFGEAGNDTIFAGDGSDYIDGGTGADVLYGQADGDTFRVLDTSGNDTIIGGETLTTGSDQDSVDAYSVTSGVNVTLDGDETGNLTFGATNIDFSEIEHFTLTDQDDTVNAAGDTSGIDVWAYDGSDSISGGSGGDTVRAGLGNDTIDGGAGDDSIYGNEDDDSITGGDGADSIYGETGNDYVDGGAGNDSLEGNEGDDTIVGGAGDDWMRGSFGNDSLIGGAGDDYLWGGFGDDTFVIEEGFGNDTVDAEGVDEVNGDTLDLSAVTSDLTVDLSNVNPEIGTFSDGVSTASFDEIENIILGGGRDTIVLADGSGSDTVQSFDMTDSGDGTTMDQLDVSGLTSDGGTTPITTADVIVTDTNGDGTGDAILSFPGGESITLVGVLSAQVDDPAELESIGIPAPSSGPDYIVEGTAGADTIDAAYTGDPEGDMIDNNDHSDGSNDDSIVAGAGNDTVLADDLTGTGPNLIVNGSFEDTTGMSSVPIGYFSTGSMPGWTNDNPAEQINVHNDGRGGLTATDGANWLDLEGAAGEQLTISQDVSGVTDGAVHVPTFDVGDISDANDGTASDNTLTVIWNGEVIANIDPSDGSWTSYKFAVVGGSGDGTDRLTFVSGGSNDSLGVSVDNVSLQLADTATGGDDTILGGAGDDLLAGGGGSDSFIIEDGFGNDTIAGGEGAADSDTLDLSATTTGVTVDLTASDPEAGSISDGIDTATFSEIENIVLGSGRDTIVLADGSGSDTVQAFDMTDSGDGTTNDQLDVSGLTSDGGTTPVHAGDVVVTETPTGTAPVTRS